MNQLSLMQTNINTVNYGGAMKMMRILVRLVSCWGQTYWLPNKIRVLFYINYSACYVDGKAEVKLWCS